MKKFPLVLILSLNTYFTFSQNVICSVQDKAAFEIKINETRTLRKNTIGETMVAIGRTFLGTPYVTKTLEVGETESLVVNLQGLDCTTFIENVLALSMLLKTGSTDFESFTNTLKTIRYKNGILDGYSSRLHYFSEWIANNQFKGIVTNVTEEIGGIPIKKPINFMSTHRNLYPFLKNNDKNLEKIRVSEHFLNSESACILPQDQIEANEHLIQSGDIIALTTSIEGLDITHTGIATREEDGRIHLLHASTSGGVTISEVPLTAYLKRIKNNTGIMVARVK